MKNIFQNTYVLNKAIETALTSYVGLINHNYKHTTILIELEHNHI